MTNSLNSMQQPIVALLENYQSLNANAVDEFTEEDTPSALEFMRFVARNRPFIVRGFARSWPAFQRWNAAYLRNAMGDAPVKVVATPHGNADAVVRMEAGELVFVEPHETFEPFVDVLTYIQDDSKEHSPEQHKSTGRTVKYAQTQNDNLRNEYSTLFADVPTDIPFARIALEKGADAINFWLGNDRSITSLHKDNYENIFVQIRGQKHFTLLPPVAVPCVNERELPRGRYFLDGNEFTISIDGANEKAPVATWDPDDQSASTAATEYSSLVVPLRVTLDEGDMLYLPSLWYHKVYQTAGTEGFCCAVNYWYDMEFAGQFWSSNAFIRDVSNLARH